MSVKHFAALALWNLLLFITAPKHTNGNVSSVYIRASPAADGCYSYLILGENDRNINSSAPHSGYCDSHLHGWYRFTGSAGSMLSQTCNTGYYGCGSYYRGWMSGSLPSYYDRVVQRTVYFASRYGSCYSRSTSIWVQNCGSFYVYYFKRYAMSCNYRYCGSDDYASSIMPSASAAPAVTGLIAPTPHQNGCYSYRILNEYDRRDSYPSSSNAYCDYHLDGWYRFTGSAGSKLSQVCYSGYYGCGSDHRGWMSGSLPRYYDGVVQRTVYFASRYGNCYSRSTSIWVQNCGSFYVYYFKRYATSCNYRYCGFDDYTSSILPSLSTTTAMASSVSATPSGGGCYYYSTLNEYNRRDNYPSSSNSYCDYYLDGWYRFTGSAGSRLSQVCYSGYYGCGSYYRGWMSGSLPSYYDGVVQRTVYFAYKYGSCYSRSTSIWVQNCGSFYVYYFKRYATSCNYRYCGSDDYTSSILPSLSTTTAMASSVSATPSGGGCYYYSTLNEYNRRDNYPSSSNSYCDYYLDGWYRFTGSAGSRLSQVCYSGYYGCGSYYRGWMSGSLPSYYDGVVQRTVYFAYKYGSCYSRSTSIWVQNCGSFYVYYFKRYATSCNYRYCGSDDYTSSILPSLSTTTAMASSVSATPSGNGCYYYRTLSGIDRNINYHWYTGACDSNLYGWYRFTGGAGNTLAQTCRTRYYGCGSYYRGWMSGSLPRYYDGVVQRTVYFAQHYGSCYSRSTPIWVQNCGSFYVYYFKRYAMSCNYRYCGSDDYTTSILPASTTVAATASSVSPTPSEESSTVILKPTPTVPNSDACKHYQILSDPTRALSYSQWYTSKCDNQLYGWYRFMGKAGNRMQSRCPSMYGARFRCGSYYQGWLLESHPGVYEGEVSKTVCFTRQYSCYCYFRKMIKVKNCGSFYVYWLDGVPTCNLRYCGAKDSTSRISCSSNYMRIDLSRQYYNVSQYEKITLRDPTCVSWYSSGYISLGSVPNYCGSTRQENKGHIIYTNEVIMKAKQNADMVTRDHDEVIQFSCKYDRDGVVSGSSYLPVSRISGNESSFGSFSFYLEMFKSKLYNSPYYSYPVNVQLRDYLYFQVRASTQDSGLVLLIDQCYSTDTMNRRQPSKYMLINNGCPMDNTVRFHSSAGQQQRFSLQAFRYLNNQSTVFIHCLLFLCQNTSRDSRCTSGCPGNNVNNARFRRDLSNAAGSEEKSSSQYYLLEAGPIVLDKGKGYKVKQGGDNSNKTLMTTVIVLVVGIIGLVVAVALLFMRMQRIRSNPEREGRELGIDNAPDGKHYVNDDEGDGKRGETVM